MERGVVGRHHEKYSLSQSPGPISPAQAEAPGTINSVGAVLPWPAVYPSPAPDNQNQRSPFRPTTLAPPSPLLACYNQGNGRQVSALHRWLRPEQ